MSNSSEVHRSDSYLERIWQEAGQVNNTPVTKLWTVTMAPPMSLMVKIKLIAEMATLPISKAKLGVGFVKCKIQGQIKCKLCNSQFLIAKFTRIWFLIFIYLFALSNSYWGFLLSILFEELSMKILLIRQIKRLYSENFKLSTAS